MHSLLILSALALPAHLPALDGTHASIQKHDRYALLEVAYFDEHHVWQHGSVRGEHFVIAVANAPETYDYATWAAALKTAGWTVLTPSGAVIARRIDGGAKSWIKTTRPDQFDLLVEGPPQAIELRPPGDKVEELLPGHDVPYLAPLPTMKRVEWKEHDEGGLEVQDTSGPHMLAGPPWIEVHYQDPDGSGLETQQIYKAALEKAGWTITYSGEAGTTIAHYAQHGRDVWVKFDGGNMIVRIADVGAAAEAAKLEAALMKDGHVALYGIYFDTDKDTLEPASEATLRQIARLLALRPKLRLEIQGHTDAQGARDHNQELSDARAAAVQKWLVDHQIDPARLVAKGYADTVPVADNKSEAGRAKNRRVELVKLR